MPFWILALVVVVAGIGGLTFVNVLWRRHATLRHQADQAALDQSFARHGGAKRRFVAMDYALQAKGQRAAAQRDQRRFGRAMAAARKAKSEVRSQKSAVVPIDQARARKAGS